MLVSILIPCFNAERWIAQCLESALAQTASEREVVVVDDGSTDGSLAVIQSFGERVRWETGPNRGGNAARNRLMEIAHGGWLQYLDADDYLLPPKIEQQLECLGRHPNADVIYGQVSMEEWADGAKSRPHYMHPLPEPHDPWVHLARWRLPQTGGSLWRKEAVRGAGGWNEELTCCQEHELYLRMLLRGAVFEHGPDGGAVYRVWGGATVSRRDPARVARTRLMILQRMQDELGGRGQLSETRLHAINTTRFETARMLWASEPAHSLEIMRSVRRCEPGFQPEGPAASLLYRCLYAAVGFQLTERLAGMLRGTRQQPRSAQAA